jgi:hypothetical protein
MWSLVSGQSTDRNPILLYMKTCNAKSQQDYTAGPDQNSPGGQEQTEVYKLEIKKVLKTYE